jgi:hypothetical protein
MISCEPAYPCKCYNVYQKMVHTYVCKLYVSTSSPYFRQSAFAEFPSPQFEDIDWELHDGVSRELKQMTMGLEVYLRG